MIQVSESRTIPKALWFAKAGELGVPVLDEDGFRILLEQGPDAARESVAGPASEPASEPAPQ